ncbi:hypothetical protein N8J89_15600 [Crossiella sp. CA-258035]|uniref:hypothetical protein n=1 Tax=Crossiella sp. CA-258035 TaxID=2981138 RepID=UPI0024BD1FE5|nr:hypothetical protein [Crossiella sp. CA-258035]WHT22432.1 hypothetical protein N8J89_15600 [Crossiella sp. CA-258035]
MLATALMAVSTLVSLAGLVLDDRLLGGQPIWGKPLKFSVSLLLYLPTWAWMLSLQRVPRRWTWWTATAIAVLTTLEVVLIVLQVIRGQASHFNQATPFDDGLFRLMGAMITVVWVLNMAQGVVLLRDRLPDRPMAWAIRGGIVLGSIGIGLAFLMTGPTPDQLHALQQNLPVEVRGAHSVGVPDGGPGMPLTGWSLTGGDLRIPHFIGIHAMQALPLLALLLTSAAARRPRLADPGVRTRLVLLGTGTYAGITGLVTWQALRGQSIVAPDAWTLLALGALVLATGLLAGRILRRTPEPVAEPVPLG